MRQLDDLRQSWQTFSHHHSLDDLKSAVRTEDRSEADSTVLRSAYWKAFLFFEGNDYKAWPASLAAARSAYDALHARFNNALTSSTLPDDPLADGIEEQWLVQQEDEDLRAEILQDLVRLPDDDYLRNPGTQKTLLSILFVFSKLNPDLSYRQGMHELLAPILTVIASDALDLSKDDKLCSDDALLVTVFDASFIEHDAFTLFCRVMQNAKDFYEHTSHRAAENPLILRSKHITEDLLQQADPQLSRHLERLDIPPQLYLMRWLRLLFGREFGRQDVLRMWDIIFAEDVTMGIVDHICVLMLLRIRWDLLSADYDTALSLLLRYSMGDARAQCLAIDAIHLRDRLSSSTGRQLIIKYTSRTPVDSRRRSGTPPAMQRNITTFSGVNALQSAWRGAVDPSKGRDSGEQPSNLEAVLQNTARSIFERSEQLGIGKAVRTAVDDIHRRAQKIRDIEGFTSSSPQSRSPRTVRSPQSRLAEFEQRNKQLALMLEHATQYLWEVQKQLTEAEVSSTHEKNQAAKVDLEELSLAVGKVQFVQLHLQDSTLRLNTSDVRRVDTTMEQLSVSSNADMSTDISQQLQASLDLDSKEYAATEATARNASPKQLGVTNQPLSMSEGATKTSGKQATASRDDHKSKPEALRPPLAESAYSWMLGQQEDVKPPTRQQRPNNLFGT